MVARRGDQDRDGGRPLTGAERAAAEHLAGALGMTQAQAIGVIALTEQKTVLFAGGLCFLRGGDPPAPPDYGGLRAPHTPCGGDGAKTAPPPHGG